MSNEKTIRPSDLPPKFLRVKKVMVDGFDGGATRAFEYLDRTDSVGVLGVACFVVMLNPGPKGES